MSHVDEGALHAYLDGALDEYPAAEARRVREHVETCAECADRLAEERRVREDARAILDLAAPEVEVPTFEELRAYVRAGQSKRAASTRVYRMGWAASVVLALGTGWMLRGSGLDPTVTFQGRGIRVPAPQERALDEAAREGASPAREEIERDAPADVPAPPVVAAPAPAPTFERAAAEPPAVVGGADKVEVAQSQAPAPAAGPGAVGDVVSDQLAAAGARARDDAAAGSAAGFGGVVADLDAQRQLSDARVQERIDSAARVAEARRRVSASQGDVTVTSAIDAAAPAPAAQRAQAANEVQRDEESTSLVVPGLRVLDVRPVSEGTAFAGTRVLQQLESGDTLEVIHLPEGVEPSLLAPLPAGTSELVRQTPEGWLVMRGPVSMPSLEQLLERLHAAR
jgi:hypothetical protein